MQVKVKRVRASAKLPVYKTDGSAGFDLFAAEEVIVEPGDTKKIPLGLAFEIPKGYVLYIVPRSGISLRTKLRQPNSVGVIDSDYRGEVQMLFENTSNEFSSGSKWEPFSVKEELIVDRGRIYPYQTYLIRKGEAICQGIIQKVEHASFIESDELSETTRGTGGFGSTGV
ncbi:deoxyuridine 5'-triphosphate nucleotidohydrolase [Halalkalibacterium halodurans]|uniref:dUTP diphosphatase n=1 Tax=Halalkalibacterium halodurans TaxID=86665 RepID=UPI002E220641|nr:deoxyuridine 5'-triphosphate nucleotidohydrolase [Halalkalibacterium halodurans]MED4105522.1 deoxyuridine 5'-triphosphate nucleotidohydrolase [Halalkalibacterium halodurans]MED4109272.1 deoxyuridine 5'-triphosphate nucleotidohydrolase [Halalkalibacterium halodurans]MED4149714.1 deoxyuridine 5'-triphosphate nucleotidohydrolase [Halalkalibacterium halodurans]